MKTRSDRRVTASVLADVNLETGSRWRLEGRLAGGVLGGAWRVRSDSVTAVFKWHGPTSSAPYNPDGPEVVAYLRANGYPTPAWLASGSTPAGISWWIQELIPGRPMGQLDDAGAQLIIELVMMHRRLSPPTSFSWSAFMQEHAFGRHPSHLRATEAGGVVSSVLAQALALAAPHESVAIPEIELVHCDLSVANIFLQEGRLSGVIDIDAAGRGCAVYDALSPALADVVYSPSGGPIHLLHEFALDEFGSAAVVIAAATLVSESLGAVAWSEPHDREVRAGKCAAWLAAIERLL
jgi:hypothetical protein